MEMIHIKVLVMKTTTCGKKKITDNPIKMPYLDL